MSPHLPALQTFGYQAVCWVHVHVRYVRVRVRATLCVQIKVFVYMRARTAHHQEEARESQESAPLASPAGVHSTRRIR